MAMKFFRLEQEVFRRLNGVVDPLVSRGIASSAKTPASLIVLESIGFKSGQARRTPLWSLRFGPYRLVSTARGRRSFWVKNLQKQSQVQYSLDGEEVASDAIVIAPGYDNLEQWELSPWLERALALLKQQVGRGWAFALLVPADG